MPTQPTQSLTPGPPPGSSFKTLKHQPPPRQLIMAIDGHERQGKTHFALTAPGPLAYQQMDPGGRDVLPKFTAEKTIWHSTYYTDVQPGLDARTIATTIADPIWKKITQDFEAALKAGARSIVKDTATEEFVCLRLARFGKLTQVMPEDYGPVYAEYRRQLRLAYQYTSNVIFLHKLKKEFDRPAGEERKKGGGKWTGGYVRDGFSGIGYEVQMECEAFREKGEFLLKVINCRQNPQLDGEVLDNTLCQNMTGVDLSFPAVAKFVYPDSDIEEWL